MFVWFKNEKKYKTEINKHNTFINHKILYIIQNLFKNHFLISNNVLKNNQQNSDQQNDETILFKINHRNNHITNELNLSQKIVKL